ncbi:MAG: hypothetical protein KDC83_00885 [Flavobacteriales bacterium]|nr:hypothetical protein [Flavobacteriales bacterium]
MKYLLFYVIFFLSLNLGIRAQDPAILDTSIYYFKKNHIVSKIKLVREIRFEGDVITYNDSAILTDTLRIYHKSTKGYYKSDCNEDNLVEVGAFKSRLNFCLKINALFRRQDIVEKYGEWDYFPCNQDTAPS